jgi:hypothetical protein
LFSADCSKSSYAAGVISGAGRNHAGAKNREIRKQAASPTRGWLHTAAAAAQKTPASGYYRCS